MKRNSTTGEEMKKLKDIFKLEEVAMIYHRIKLTIDLQTSSKTDMINPA